MCQFAKEIPTHICYTDMRYYASPSTAGTRVSTRTFHGVPVLYQLMRNIQMPGGKTEQGIFSMRKEVEVIRSYQGSVVIS